MRVNVCFPIFVLLVNAVCSWLTGCACEAFTLLQTVTGSVTPGNYSYYKLSRGGNIRLLLRTLEGDADVYVSGLTLHPTYDDYELKSTTYGDEVVDITELFIRPVGIGIYGHPLYLNETLYEFDILLDTVVAHDPWRTENSKDEPPAGKHFTEEDPEKESMLWNLFIGILKVAVDVMI